MLIALFVALALQPSPAMLRQLFEQELAARKANHGDADARTAQAARDLGLFLARQGDASAARDVLAEAVRIDQKAFGPAAPRTLADVAELAAVSGSESLWRQASNSPDAAVAAKSLAALGSIREQVGDRAGAAKFYRQALAKEELSTGKDSSHVAARLNTLSLVVAPPEAIALLERALRISTARLGSRRIETASIEMNLAARLLKAGRLPRAARLAKAAASTFEETLGAEHPRTVASYRLVANTLRTTGDTSAAEAIDRRAREIESRTTVKP